MAGGEDFRLIPLFGSPLPDAAVALGELGRGHGALGHFDFLVLAAVGVRGRPVAEVRGHDGNVLIAIVDGFLGGLVALVGRVGGRVFGVAHEDFMIAPDGVAGVPAIGVDPGEDLVIERVRLFLDALRLLHQTIMDAERGELFRILLEADGGDEVRVPIPVGVFKSPTRPLVSELAALVARQLRPEPRRGADELFVIRRIDGLC